MIAGKFWSSLRAQLNKLANFFWAADPIAQMQYEYDTVVETDENGNYLIVDADPGVVTLLADADGQPAGATVFAYHVTDPERAARGIGASPSVTRVNESVTCQSVSAWPRTR